ncbi:MAG: Ldh family oxidoreductase [Actinobacteria bacterium]|nr:Ldh family oxidoreductase [Actinomycetota bacterium]
MPDDLINFCSQVLEKAGISKDEARIAAEIITSADMRGVNSHGSVYLQTFVKRIKEGGIDPKADIEILRQGPAWALLDGHGAMGQLTAYKATKIAIDKAKSCGVSIVGIKNGMHFGAAAYYSMMIAKQDMIGISMSNADITMAITGSSSRVIGNNPFSYAAPAGEEKPVVLDMAMSVVAGGKIKLAMEEGKNIPFGWLLNPDGEPTSSPRDFFDGGALLPFAGYKGYGLALMVEILAGVITGNPITRDIISWTKDLSHPCPEGFAFIAINIGNFRPIEEYKARMDVLIRQIRSSPKAKGVERIYLPGELEYEKEERARISGIVLGSQILKSLKNLATDLGLSDKLNSVIKEVNN